jgi:glutamate carboxypeptidase
MRRSGRRKDIIREGIAGAGAALVFEAGRTDPPDAIITRRKGTGGMTARAFGKAAHAGNNHKDGVNALWAIARFTDRIQQLSGCSTLKWPHLLL